MNHLAVQEIPIQNLHTYLQHPFATRQEIDHIKIPKLIIELPNPRIIRRAKIKPYVSLTNNGFSLYEKDKHIKDFFLKSQKPNIILDENRIWLDDFRYIIKIESRITIYK